MVEIWMTVLCIRCFGYQRWTFHLKSFSVVTRTQIIHILTINLCKKSRDGQLDAEEGRGVLLYPKSYQSLQSGVLSYLKSCQYPQSSLLNKLFPCLWIGCIHMSWFFLVSRFAHVWLFAWVVPNLRGFEGGRCLWKTAAWSQWVCVDQIV